MNGLVKTEMVEVKPSQAQTWLGDNLYEKQRRLRIDHVSFLADEMKKGRFTQGTQIAFAVLDGREKLINGQHTLQAIVTSSMPQTLNIVKHYVETEDDIALLYSREDRHKTRTIAEVYGAFDLAEELGLTKTQTDKLGGAVRLIMSNFKATKRIIAPDDLLAMMREYQDEARTYFALIDGFQVEVKSGLNRASTLGVAIATLKYAVAAIGEEKVYSFWHGAALDDGLLRNDPRKTLHSHLMLTSISGGGVITKPAVSKQFSARYVAQCWNAWVEGRTLAFTKVKDQYGNIKILHTPWQ